MTTPMPEYCTCDHPQVLHDDGTGACAAFTCRCDAFVSDGVKVGSPQHRARLIRIARRLAGDIRQIFLDAAHWNRTHPGQRQIDVDPDGLLQCKLDGLEFTLACEAACGGIGPIEPADAGDPREDDDDARRTH